MKRETPPEIKGFVMKRKCKIQHPKFEEKHISFISKYLEAKIERKGELTEISPAMSKDKIQMAIDAYVYEFGEW